MDSSQSLSDRIVSLQADCEALRRRLDKIARLAPVDAEDSTEPLAELSSRCADLRAEAAALLDGAASVGEVSAEQLLSHIAAAEATLCRRKQAEAWRELLTRLFDELSRCRFVHPAPPIRATGEAMIAAAKATCLSLRDDQNALTSLAACSPANEAGIEFWQQYEAAERTRLVSDWPAEAQPLADLILSVDSLAGPEPPGETTLPEPETADSETAEPTPAVTEFAGQPISGDQRPSMQAGRETTDGERIGGAGDPRADSPGLTALVEPAGDSTRPDDSPSATEIGITAAGVAEQPREVPPAADRVATAVVDGGENSRLLPSPTALEPAVGAATSVAGPGGPEAAADAVQAESFDEADVAEPSAVAADPATIDAINDTAWQALGDGRPGLAYHLLASAQRVYPEQGLLPRSLAAVTALAPAVEENMSSLVTRARSEFETLQLQLLEGQKRADFTPCCLLALAAAMRPTLLAPASESGQALQTIPPPADAFPRFALICAAIRDYGQHRIVVDAAVLAGICDQAEWRKRLGDAVDSLDEWLQNERVGKVIFAPTTNVWRQWTAAEGPVGSVVAAVIKGDAPARGKVEQFLNQWAVDRFIDKECNETDATTARARRAAAGRSKGGR